MVESHEPLRLAARCRYLQVTLADSRSGQARGLRNLCRHIIRDGSECVGPFLEDTETACGLWEERPRSGTYGLRG